MEPAGTYPGRGGGASAEEGCGDVDRRGKTVRGERMGKERGEAPVKKAAPHRPEEGAAHPKA